MTDRITEHYDTEARLVTDEEPRHSARNGAQKRKGSGKTAKKTADTAEKALKSGKPAKSAKREKTAERPEEHPSVKTPSVMRLVEERSFSENQVVAAGKSLIPRQLRKMEPLSKVIRREAERENAEPTDEVSSSPMVMRDLSEMVIAECAPGILKRFNACDCDKCMSELARLTAEEVPARYMKMPELAEIGWSGFSVDERMMIDSLKKNVVTVMIRLMIANKKRNFH